MNIEEIQAALAELVAAMVEKGVVLPDASFSAWQEKMYVCLRAYGANQNPFGDKDYFFCRGAAPEDCFCAAWVVINAIPSPEDRVTQEYLGKVADAIDYGTKHSIDDKYVTPLRGVTKQMTDNLLTKEPTQ